MAILKFKNENGEWEAAETPGALKYTEQTLTESQKAQVKANLGITNSGGGSGTAVYVGTDLSDYNLASGKGTLELAIGAEKPWQVGDLYVDTVYNSIYRCASYTSDYTYTWELIFGELLSSVHTGTELYDNSNGAISNNKVSLMIYETKSWKPGNLYIDTDFNAIFKCTDCYFRGYYAYTWDLIANLGGGSSSGDGIETFENVTPTTFNWFDLFGITSNQYSSIVQKQKTVRLKFANGCGINFGARQVVDANYNMTTYPGAAIPECGDMYGTPGESFGSMGSYSSDCYLTEAIVTVSGMPSYSSSGASICLSVNYCGSTGTFVIWYGNGSSGERPWDSANDGYYGQKVTDVMNFYWSSPAMAVTAALNKAAEATY